MCGFIHHIGASRKGLDQLYEFFYYVTNNVMLTAYPRVIKLLTECELQLEQSGSYSDSNNTILHSGLSPEIVDLMLKVIRNIRGMGLLDLNRL
jgi:hypothetical protein